MHSFLKKILLVIGLLELAINVSGGYIHHHQSYDQDEHHHEPAHYDFEYKVHDPHTGDEKMHHETNIGGVVKGFYMLREADGTIREVHYTADKIHGFQAEVKKIGHPIHPSPSYHKKRHIY